MEGRLFFVGLAVVILGLLIIVYDYPQVIYIQTMSNEDLQLFDKIEIEKFQRVQNELLVGIGILGIGAVMLFFSKFKPDVFTRK